MEALQISSEQERIQGLHELTKRLRENDSLDSLVQCIAEYSRRIAQVNRASLIIRNSSENADVWELDEKGSRVRSMQFRGSSLERVCGSASEYVDNSIGKYSDFFDERELANEGYYSYLSIPLVVGSKVIGSINLASKQEGAFRPAVVSELWVLADFVAQVTHNKMASRRLEDSEKMTQILFEKGADVSVILEADSGKILGLNNASEKVIGYKERELVGSKISSFFNFGEKSFREIVETGGFDKRMIVRFTCKNGMKKLLEVDYEGLNFGGRNLALLSCNDVTEKLTLESDYKDVVESISDIVVSIDGRGEISAINEEVRHILGYSRESLIGQPFGTLVYDSDFRTLGGALQDLQAGKESIRGLEIRLRNKYGEPKYFEMNAHAYHDANGELIKITGVLKDIDEQKKAQQQAEVVANVIENSSDSIYCTDTMGVIQLWNKGAERIFGYSKDEMVGRNVSILYPEDQREELNYIISELNKGKGIVGLDGVRMKKGGDPLYVSISASPVRGEKGKIDGYMEIVQDTTAKRKMQENEEIRKRLEEKNKQLKEVNEMKSVFVSNVSHELRTPLTSIHGYSALLKDGMAGKMSDQQGEYVKIIFSETERLAKLINDLLDLSRIDSGKIKLRMEFFDIRDLVSKCSCISLAHKKGLYVKWNISDEVLDVYGDPARIAQVFINLVSNAIKFTEEGGVTINITKKTKTFIQVEVLDTGMGIPEEEQKHLFKRFYQVQKARQKKLQGTGLGLTISREIIKLHGGKISVDSKVGDGTKFTFTLRAIPTRKQRRKMKKQKEAAAK